MLVPGRLKPMPHPFKVILALFVVIFCLGPEVLRTEPPRELIIAPKSAETLMSNLLTLYALLILHID